LTNVTKHHTVYTALRVDMHGG